MAKTTRLGGASHEDDVPPVRITRAVLGGVPKSVGDSFTQSSESESKQSDSGKRNPRKRAPTTGNRSRLIHKETSDADLTDGAGQRTESTQSDKAGVRTFDVDDDFFE